ncbi:MAG: glucokinase [Deltaproteobacteria bacterium]|nr:glucokinase [Deltaproteobacteria bacterium]
MIVLAGDIGGKTSRLALLRDNEIFFEKAYPSADHASLDAVADKFIHDVRKALGPDTHPRRACFGVPGPVENNTCRVTNLPWFVDAKKIEAKAKIEKVALVNDFQAAALGVTVIGQDSLHEVGGKERNPTGPIVVMGAGTGLGEGFLFWSPADNRYQVIASEGGHVDFTPRSALETGLMTYMAGRYGRVSYERVLSAQGLADIFGFLTSEPSLRPLVAEDTKGMMVVEDPAAVIARQAMEGKDPICVMAINLFCSILGGLAGNLALTFLATGGVFIAGGIAPRITPVMSNGVFRQAFEAKGRFQPLVAKIPCFVVTHPSVGLLGAASVAARL